LTGELTAASKAVIDEHIQSIQDYLGDRNHADGKIRFPRGFLRTVGSFSAQLGFVRDATLRSNICYALVTADVLRWITNRTDLWGLPKEMISKMGVVLMASICEALSIEGTRGVIGRRHRFCERANRMENAGIITTHVREELHWLWDKRGGIHLHDVTVMEYGVYDVKDYNRAVRVTRELRNALEAYHGTPAA
jgi:hypothetical protein